MSVSQKIIKNTVFNFIGYFWGILVALLLTPYIIQHIGIERYGVLAIIGSVTGYFGLFDFGVGHSFVKYISEFFANKEYKKINQVINIGFAFYSVFGVFIIAIAFFIIKPLFSFFKIPIYLYNEMLFVFLLGIILFALSGALSIFKAIQTGLQQMDISNKIAIAVSIPNIIGTILFLERGYGLPGLMVNNAIIFFISSIINILVAYRIFPALRFNPFLFEKGIFKMLFNFGIKRWVTFVEEIITFQTDRILIAHFLNIGLVGLYQLGFVIVDKVRVFLGLLTSAVVPAVSELDATGQKEKIVELYSRSTRYMSAVSIPIFTFFFATAHLVMLIWMGHGYEKSELVIRILAPAFLMGVLVSFAASTAVGIGRPDFQMKSGGGQAILNLILSIILVIKIGFAGVVIATLISVSLSAAYLMAKFHSYLKIPLYRFIKKNIFKPLIASLIAGIVISLVNFRFNNLMYNRVSNLIFFIYEGFLFLVCYFLILWKSGFINKRPCSG